MTEDEDRLLTPCPNCRTRPYRGTPWHCEAGDCPEPGAMVWHGPGRDSIFCLTHGRLIRERCKTCGGTGAVTR